MQIDYTRSFKKQYKKLPRKLQMQFDERLTLFVDNTEHSLLRVHGLTGKYKKCSSINITGDIRAIFEILDDGTVLFVAIGSHSELYS